MEDRLLQPGAAAAGHQGSPKPLFDRLPLHLLQQGLLQLSQIRSRLGQGRQGGEQPLQLLKVAQLIEADRKAVGLGAQVEACCRRPSDQFRAIGAAHPQGVQAGRQLGGVPQGVQPAAQQLPQQHQATGDRREAIGTVVHRVEAGHHRQQNLGGADVAGGLVPADVLLAGLQGQAQRRMALGIHRLPHQAPWDLALVGWGGREEGRMGSAKTQGDPQALGAAHRNLDPQFGHRRHQHLGHGIDGGRHDHARVARCSNDGPGVPEGAGAAGQLQQQTKGITEGLRALQQLLGLDPLQDELQRFSPGLQDRPGLREDRFIHQETARVAVAAGPQAQGHRLGRCRGLIQQRGVGDRQARELADQGLEIEQRLQPPLADLRLIGGVGRVPGRVLEDMTLDQRRGNAAVVAQADQRAAHLVGRRNLLQLRQRLGLLATRG